MTVFIFAVLFIALIFTFVFMSSSDKKDEIAVIKKRVDDAMAAAAEASSSDAATIDDGPYITKLRADISDAVSRHTHAINLLQSISRIDGNTSESERNISFAFLVGQNESLSKEHRTVFYGDCAGEFQHAVSDNMIDSIIYAVQPKPFQYRIEVAASAMAIVYSGGEPKKREAMMLEKIRAELLKP